MTRPYIPASQRGHFPSEGYEAKPKKKYKKGPDTQAGRLPAVPTRKLTGRAERRRRKREKRDGD